MPLVRQGTPQQNTAPKTSPSGTPQQRLAWLLGNLYPLPSKWLGGGPEALKNGGKLGNLQPAPCTSYIELIGAWRKAMYWTRGLDCALSVMLASVTSTRTVGDQLWVKIIGPPSCGKSTLAEALSVSGQYVMAKSTIRGFHSGFGSEKDEDNSLLVQLHNKTLIVKDGDTLLQAPNRGQILSEARDIYDRVSRTHYRNKMSRTYEGINLTWILCGTSSLRAIDTSELGERFLDCVIMDQISDVLEDKILLHVGNRARGSMSRGEEEANAYGVYDAATANAMRLTGGYVDYLRENAEELLASTKMSNKARDYCIRLGKFTAYMRARPNANVTEAATRECASRLVSQHIRMSLCLAVVLNREEVDEEVMQRIRKVCLDTSRGATLQIVQLLREHPEGCELGALAVRLNQSEGELVKLLRFLVKVKVVQTHTGADFGGRPMRGRLRYTITPLVTKLYEEIVQ